MAHVDVAHVDVAIVGAGPAGCAAAITMAAHAPDLRIAHILGRPEAPFDLGECVLPPIRDILSHLGLWERFVRDGHRPSSRSSAAWGSPHLASNDRLFQIDRIAWHLDRARFDAMLRRAAAGAAPAIDARLHSAERSHDGLSLQLDDGRRLTARFGIDATGRAAALARALGATCDSIDRLVAAAAVVPRAPDHPRDLTIESDAGGWWYGNARADGSCLVVRMSDADLMRRSGPHAGPRFGEDLARTRHLAPSGGAIGRPDWPRLLPAASRRLLAPDLPLVAAGDAAWTQDPISGEGILKALRSGIYAAYAVADSLTAADPSGLARYRRFVDGAWQAYRARLGDQYGRESRWPDAPFWQRRADLRGAARTKKPAGLAPGGLDLVAGTGFEPVTFRL